MDDWRITLPFSTIARKSNFRCLLWMIALLFGIFTWLFVDHALLGNIPYTTVSSIEWDPVLTSPIKLLIVSDNNTSTLTPLESLSRKMTVYFQGGLGNLMFQYASLIGIANKTRFLPVIFAKSEVAKVFSPSAVLSHDLYFSRRFKSVGEKLSCAFDSNLFDLGNDTADVQLNGYFQSWKYFDHIKDEIRRQFTFSDDVISAARSQLFHVTSKFKDKSVDAMYIGVHVRLGDFQEKKHLVDYGYVSADKKYLDKAMNYFRQKYRNSVFVVASNKMSWCHENINGSDVHFLKSTNSRELDMSILSMCNHTVMTVGSFGWWSAWLAGGDVVYYKGYPRPRSKLDSLFVSEDYRYPHWIGM